ncbi:acetate--CoA ligase family protein [Desulfococcaceae bacterium HSG8]|nr:acetate--CoA ligase family protein [Desulfococcaceae bacterium HSG8]
MLKTEWIDKAKAEGRNTLTEAESKSLISAYGVPVVSETVAHDENQAVTAAETIGFPVVLKGLGANLTHKTERGLVRLGLTRPADVSRAAGEMIKTAGDELEGFLVQPQLTGKRELVAGLFHDEQFGPVVMFGVGGVFTEALRDVTFRLAPLSESDASEMLDDIRAQELLKACRGEKPANREQLLRTLMGLSNLAADRPDISEIDINPLIVGPDGEITAADALVVIGNGDRRTGESYTPVDPYELGALFYPKSVAFVGASATLGKWGHLLLTNTVSGGFEGKIYLVNPKGGTIAGRPVYPSVNDIPDEVDLAVVTVPAAHVSDLIPQFKEKGIKGMLLITSGFREAGPEGEQSEKDIVRIARDAGIIILGPNTMGICNPHVRLFCNAAHVHPLPGSTTLVAQSGNLGTQLLAFAERQGLGIRAFSGSGNEAMVTIEDYMEAFEADKRTRTVVLYIESVKNGRRFFESARRVSRKKPVIILKGGCTDAGSRAAASHTGAMASDSRIFDAACRQAGIIQVEQPMELLDLSAVLSSLPLPKGNRVGIMTLGGGWGVVTSDLCARYGLEVPPLSAEIIRHFDEMLPPYWSRSNPVDLVGENDPRLPMIGLEELLKWEGCDAVINLGIHGRKIFTELMIRSASAADPDYSEEFLESLREKSIGFEEEYIAHVVRLMETYDKPILGVSLVTEDDRTLYNIENSAYKGVFFPSPERAVKALAKMCEYVKRDA